MENLNAIFSKNLIRLRKCRKLTQLELSEKLNYSDRNISKWENGSALPTTETLKELSDFFGVSMDYFFEEHDDKETLKKVEDLNKIKIFVICLSVLAILLISIICFISFPKNFNKSWLSFVWGLVASLIVCVTLCSIWFRKNLILFVFISLLVWTIITGTYLTILIILSKNLWFLFFIGVPIQLGIIFWSRMPRYRK